MNDFYIKFRFYILQVVLILAFMILAAKLWQLQIVAGQEYGRAADENRFRLVPMDAPRGIVYDRVGRMLVRNIPSFTISVVPAGLPDDSQERRAVLQRVGALVGMAVESASLGDITITQQIPLTGTQLAPITGTVSVRGSRGPSIEQLIQERTISPYAPVRIASNVDRQAAFILEEEHLKLPGVVVTVDSVRQYTDGPLMAHLLGYMGRIPSSRLNEYTGDPTKDYQPDDLVGLMGIERTQEKALRGIKGRKHIEVDAYEREVAVIASEPATPGNNVILTVDMELQRYVEEALREGMGKAGSASGVAIAMDPRTGEILAMVSLPSYDNNLFSGGISFEDFDRLNNDKRHPLVNHAISGQYPPGSTFKIVTASGALQEKVISATTTRACGGALYLANKFAPGDLSKAQRFVCWLHSGHGALNVVGAIQNSCDIFFYQVAGGYEDFAGLGIARLGRYAQMFGYGSPTGVDLVGEASGFVPSDRWKRQTYGQPWFTGDTYNAAIGQGDILATPLQALNAAATIANGGTLLRPQLVYQVTNPDGQVISTLRPDPIHKLAVASENIELVRRGMLLAVSQGTAPLAQLPGIAVAGKTGTAEYTVFDEQGRLVRDSEGRLPTHAWFTAFAPFDNPQIAVVVFLEGGGEGSRVSVPVAAKILRYYFGIPDPKPAPTASAPAPAAVPLPTRSGTQPTQAAGGH